MPWNGSGTFNRTNGVYSGAEVWKQSAAAGRNVRADDADIHDRAAERELCRSTYGGDRTEPLGRQQDHDLFYLKRGRCP